MDDLLPVAKAPPPKPNTLTFALTVPAGHVLPLGEVVEEAFDVTVVAGARWFPEWDAPRVGVTAFLMLPQGDAVCFAGNEANALPLPKPIGALATKHGEPVTLLNADVIEALGLAIPTKPEPYSSFHAKRAHNRYTVH